MMRNRAHSWLNFDRLGRLLSVDSNALVVVTDAGETTRIACPGICEAVGFDDEVWAVAAGCLVRFDVTGVERGSRFALPFAREANLVAAPYGAPAAAWGSAVLVGTNDAISMYQHDVDAVVPLNGRRAVLARGSRLTLPSGQRVELPPRSTILAGAVVADGKLLALDVSGATGRELVVVLLGTGRVAMRRPLGRTHAVAFGETTVAIQSSPRTVCLVDVRRSRDVGTMTVAPEIAALAIDATGTRLAVRSPDGENAVLEVVVDAKEPARTSAHLVDVPPTNRVEIELAIPAELPRLQFNDAGRVTLVDAPADTTDTTAPAPIAIVEAAPVAASEHVAARAMPMTTLDWIYGGGDHLGGLY